MKSLQVKVKVLAPKIFERVIQGEKWLDVRASMDIARNMEII